MAFRVSLSGSSFQSSVKSGYDFSSMYNSAPIDAVINCSIGISPSVSPSLASFNPLTVDRENASPLAVDVTLLADETIVGSDATKRNIYEQIDYPASAAPGGGW